MNSKDCEIFWTTLFEENELALQLTKLANEKEHDESKLKLPLGCVKLNVARASALGDNFMSDTYIIEAVMEKESKASIKSFAKVYKLEKKWFQIIKIGKYIFDSNLTTFYEI